MNKTTRIIIIALVAIFLGGVMITKMPKNKNKLDPYTIYDGREENGGIGDHVKGNADAKVILYEYADYQCSACAISNAWFEELVDEYEGKIGIVYRSYLLSYHKNARAAAAAAEAAAFQGYWQEYGGLLFANQSEWGEASASEREKLFAEYFLLATNGKGDIERFRSDMASEAVQKKIDFDVSMGNQVDLSATPAIYMDGELIDWYDNTTKDSMQEFMRGVIDKKLAEVEAE